MKVLMINGSPHKEGNTYIALHEMEKIFSKAGIETEILHIGNREIRGCVACRSCLKSGNESRGGCCGCTQGRIVLDF